MIMTLVLQLHYGDHVRARSLKSNLSNLHMDTMEIRVEGDVLWKKAGVSKHPIMTACIWSKGTRL